MEVIKSFGELIFKSLPILSWVIAPIATYFINRYLQKRDKNKGYRRASKKIVSLLKPIVLEEKNFTVDLISSLINSVSRDEDIDVDRMESPEIILDELILDIVDSGFVTNDKKIEISQRLLSLKSELKEEYVEKDSIPSIEVAETINNEKADLLFNEYHKLMKRDRIRGRVTLLISTLSVYIALLTVLLAVIEKNSEFSLFKNIVGENPVIFVILSLVGIGGFVFNDIFKK
ncbi:hypothetical protein [Enterococcus sp. UD-01]|jgi:hypothetical protein|uniref:hypothetical protein n=1 Tax=Enterococcus sp. UD-01 TaxID=3373911 RepID=UPI0038383747